jgi:hypothetical protein
VVVDNGIVYYYQILIHSFASLAKSAVHSPLNILATLGCIVGKWAFVRTLVWRGVQGDFGRELDFRMGRGGDKCALGSKYPGREKVLA